MLTRSGARAPGDLAGEAARLRARAASRGSRRRPEWTDTQQVVDGRGARRRNTAVHVRPSSSKARALTRGRTSLRSGRSCTRWPPDGARSMPRAMPGLIAAILQSDPPPLDPSRVPSSLARIVRICLDKDPANRWSTAHDVVLALQGIEDGLAGVVPAARPRRHRERLAWGVAAAAAILAAVLVFQPRKPSTTLPLDVVSIVPPGGTTLVAGEAAQISPTGARSPSSRATRRAAFFSTCGRAIRAWRVRCPRPTTRRIRSGRLTAGHSAFSPGARCGRSQ